MTGTTPRFWDMTGASNAINGVWWALGGPRYVRAHGAVPVPVRVFEDPDGDYMGWLDTGNDPTPVMIQHKRIFNVQFPYGYEAEERHGRGSAVRLRIEVRDEAE